MTGTAQEKISIEDFFGKCDQIHRKLWIWSHLLKKSLMENLLEVPKILQKFVFRTRFDSYIWVLLPYI